VAHQALRFFFVGVSAAFLGACGSSDPQPTAPTATTITNPPENSGDPQSWGTIHSARFALTIPLPDAASWAVDDQTRAELVAAYKPTHSLLVAKMFIDSDLVNRARCEQGARDQGLVPAAMTNAQTIEDLSLAAPADFDTRVWVAIRSGKKDAELVGDVFVFGAHIRKCIFVHYATIVASDHEADTLSDRLAAARLHIVHDLAVDAIEAVPRDAHH
jgi:hypothetical protein